MFIITKEKKHLPRGEAMIFVWAALLGSGFVFLKDIVKLLK
jgi:hypothetical protein